MAVLLLPHHQKLCAKILESLGNADCRQILFALLVNKIDSDAAGAFAPQPQLA